MKTIVERFEAKYIPEPNSGCWLWTAALTKSGYGKFSTAHSVWEFAHRVSWRINNGAIPNNLLVLHRCDNPPCVNPTHLFLGTHADNHLDMLNKGRQERGARHHWAKLTEDQIREIRASTDSGVSLSRRFNVSRGLISLIINEKVWK